MVALLYPIRWLMLFGVGLVSFAAALFGAGAAVTVADGLSTVLGWLIRAVHALIALVIAVVT